MTTATDRGVPQARPAWLVTVTRARDAVFNDDTKRAWTASAIASAVFTMLFWLSVATGLARLDVPHGESLGGYPAAVVGLYFVAIVVAGPAIAHTAGFMLDRYTSGWRRDDAVLVFVAFGAVLGALAVTFVIAVAPTGGAFVPALWMYGLPLLVSLGIARFAVDQVVASRSWTIAVCAVAYTPAVIAALVLLGLYVGHATVPA